jgi:hypothetical protein
MQRCISLPDPEGAVLLSELDPLHPVILGDLPDDEVARVRGELCGDIVDLAAEFSPLGLSRDAILRLLLAVQCNGWVLFDNL